jgi:predicted transcriptional regulator
MVRKLFVNCIKYKNCPMKVHWIDCNMNNSKRLPTWMNELYNAHLSEKDWTKTPSIASELNTKRSLLKLLTSHGIVTKEIEKAEKINPMFTLEFAESLFAKMIVDYSSMYSKGNTVFHSFRAVMDFYTVARIIKSEMKHVIVYVGHNHAERISHILQQVGFELREKTTNPQCVTGS